MVVFTLSLVWQNLSILLYNENTSKAESIDEYTENGGQSVKDCVWGGTVVRLTGAGKQS